MNLSALKAFVDEVWDDEIVPTLTEYIKIPNKSPAFDTDWESHGYMQDAIELFKSAVRRSPIQEVESRIVTLPGRTPLLLLDVPATLGCDGAILCYGHYDKQPEFDGWKDGLGPWSPALIDGRLYGRGGADDGYAMFGALTAIAALEDQSVPHPRCQILIEGCEESGSFDLPYYLEALQPDIVEPDLLICLDAECGNYEQLWLTTSLRGMVSANLSVQVLKEGIHSGGGGGIVPSSFRILRALLNRIENPDSGQLLQALYGEIPQHAIEEAKLVAATLGETVVDRYPWHGSTKPYTDDLTELVLSNTWRPSLATVGLGGAPKPADAGNTLRPETSAQFTFRLPPNVNATDAGRALQEVLEADAPHGASVEFKVGSSETGWFAQPLHPFVQKSLQGASREFFNGPLRQSGCGGTIPFMAMLADRFPDCQCVVTGVLGPHSNAHGPNEFLDVETGKNVTASMAKVIADVGKHYPKLASTD